MKITVIGFGYIGSVISAVLSNKGHKVTDTINPKVYNFYDSIINMQIRKYLKKYPIAVQIYRRFSRLRANLSLLGLFPIRTKRIVRIPRY